MANPNYHGIPSKKTTIWCSGTNCTVNVRAAASDNGTIRDRLSKNTAIQARKVSSQSEWWRVAYNNNQKLGFVKQPFVDDPSPSATSYYAIDMLERYGESVVTSSTSNTNLIWTIQEDLAWAGYLDWRYVDGIWGDKTTAAIEALQDWEELGVDGKIGPATKPVLYKLATGLDVK